MSGIKEAGPWEAMLALVKAADDAANWITEARKRAREEGTLGSLPYVRYKVSPVARGKREVDNLRRAIRRARSVLNQDSSNG